MNLMLTQGNALRIPLADESVHCVVTSPPYWGLRDYGIGDQLGLEPTPEQYVENMVAVFREVKRILRHDGTVWLNLGDSYATGHQTGTTDDEKGWTHGQISRGMQGRAGMPDGLKPKDLCGIPWRVAFALQADGWWLRSDIIWSKPNPMPESVTDRPTKAHEYLFLLTKSARYYYDADAIKEKPQRKAKVGWKDSDLQKYSCDDRLEKQGSYKDWRKYCPTGNVTSRNRRTVWHIATAPYSGAHFATYPPALVEPCIKAGTSERGVCPECGAPWERVTEPSEEYKKYLGKGYHDHSHDKSQGQSQSKSMPNVPYLYKTLGWQRTCECGTFEQTVPATVFDPFAGSGTTLQVARALGRNGVGLDLSLEYLHLARKRLSLDALEAWGKAKKDGALVTDLPMFEELGDD